MLKHCPKSDATKRWLSLVWAYGIVIAYLYSIWIEKISREISGLL